MTGEEEQTIPIVEIWGGIFASLLARSLVALLLFLPFVLGCFVGGVGLHDPDTCWLLALGRYIFEHHALPSADPYSFTFALQTGKPFVLYQWLTELSFFLAYKVAGLSSLLMFAAFVLGQAFLVFPLRLAARFTPMSMAVFLTVLSLLSACFHFLVRPEIGSYFFMGICLILMRRIYWFQSNEPVQWRTVAAFTLLLLVWANAHSAFVLALVLQATALLVAGLQALVEKQEFKGSAKTAVFSLIGSTFATLCNPYGLGLWSYLPGLFFAKFNYRIDELRPLRLSDFHEFTYYPFLLLVLTCFVITIRAIVQSNKGNQTIRWYNVVIVIACIVSGFVSRRLIPFSVLVLVAQAAELWLEKPAVQDAIYRFGADFERKLANIFNPFTLVWPLTVASLSLCGAYFTFTRVVSPTIPQTSTAFVVPVKAIEHLRAHRPSGNVFNDAQFGDMLIWYAPEIPVFIDTRYDMHGEQMVADYVAMLSASKDWPKLMEQYKIDWLFLPPKAAIVKVLQADPHWKTEFEDKSAVVLKRTGNPPTN